MFKNSMIFIFSMFLVGCTSSQIPQEALQLNSSTLKDRELQTREYKTFNNMKVLSAGLNVMQDLGFQIDETQKKLGLITGSKNRSAVEVGEQIGAILTAVILGVHIDTAKDQKIRANFIVTKSPINKESYRARISFQRIIFGHNGNIRKVETIKDEKIYKDFFIALDKATFLEGHQI